MTGFRFAPGDGRRVVGLDTSRGPIQAETVVLAAGLWTSELARLAGASVALYPAEHVWVMTEEAAGAGADAPFLRDLDGYLYIRQYRGRYILGAFEPNGKPIAPTAVPTTGFAEFGPDWDHFAPVLAAARERVPELESIGFAHFLRAPGELHARLEPPARVRARVRRVVRGGRAQLAGHHLRPGRRSGGGRVDRRRPSDDGPRRDRCRADGALDEPARMAARADRRVAGRAVRAALAGQAAADRAGRPARAAVRAVPRGRGRVRAGGGLGAGELVRARGRGPGGRLRLPGAVVVPVRPRGGAGHPRRRRAVRPTTYAKFVVQGPAALEGLQRLATSDLDVDVRADRVHAAVQRARRHRDGPDDHAARGGPVPGPRADADPATDRGAAPARAAGRGGGDGRDLGLGHASPGRTAITGAAVPTDRCGRLGGGLAVPARPRDRRRADARRGRSASRSPGSSAGSCPCRPTRSRTCTSTSFGPEGTSGCATRARSPSMPRAWNAASGRGATTSGRSRSRSRRGSASRSRAGRRPISWAARRWNGSATPSPSGGSSASTPRTPSCGTASRCSATASEPGTSRAPRSAPTLGGSAGLGWIRGAARRHVAGGGRRRPDRVPGQPRPVLRPARGAPAQLTAPAQAPACTPRAYRRTSSPNHPRRELHAFLVVRPCTPRSQQRSTAARSHSFVDTGTTCTRGREAASAVAGIRALGPADAGLALSHRRVAAHVPEVAALDGRDPAAQALADDPRGRRRSPGRR